jgi:hypothetical protein
MLTIFSVPKPFVGHTGIIQRNAIGSWTRLSPPCEIILCADEPGTREVAAEFGARYLPQVARNEHGTPLVSSAFEIAERLCRGECLCYVNADIILMSDFMEAVRRVSRRKRRFLMVGRRWDVDITERLDFSRAGWEDELRSYVAEHGALHGSAGIDFFVFTRRVFHDLPAFALGRMIWDNWLIFRARSRGAPVIDATGAVMALHQNHDYSHHPGGEEGIAFGVEAKRNLELAGGYAFVFRLEDATHLLTPGGLRLDLSRERLARRIDRLPLLHPRVARAKRFLARVSRPVRARVSKALAGNRKEIRS